MTYFLCEAKCSLMIYYRPLKDYLMSTKSTVLILGENAFKVYCEDNLRRKKPSSFCTVKCKYFIF